MVDLAEAARSRCALRLTNFDEAAGLATPLKRASIEACGFASGLISSPTFADHEAAETARQHDLNEPRKDDGLSTGSNSSARHIVESCEREAHRRAVHGAPEPVVKSGANLTNPATGTLLTTRKYSDTLLAMLIKANRAPLAPEKDVMEKGVLDEMANDPPPVTVKRGRSL